MATPSQNGDYSRKVKGIVPYKGVTLDKRDNSYNANIIVNRKRIYLGSFKTPEQAHEAYKEAAIKYFGEFARFE